MSARTFKTTKITIHFLKVGKHIAKPFIFFPTVQDIQQQLQQQKHNNSSNNINGSGGKTVDELKYLSHLGMFSRTILTIFDRLLLFLITFDQFGHFRQIFTILDYI